MLNKGYLVAKRTIDSDECLTPLYAVKPLLSIIPSDSRIWCPFDTEDSNYVKLLSTRFTISFSHINKGEDFFELVKEKKDYDIIVSNPPFSKKWQILKELIDRNIPFILLFPFPALASHQELIKELDSIIIFDKRIGYYTPDSNNLIKEGSPFASCYISRKVSLPRQIIFMRLIK